MPAVGIEATTSTGHGCWPPSNAVGPYSTKTKINGKFVQLKGVTRYAPHTCGETTHSGAEREISTGSNTCFIEGVSTARIGDLIECGDAVSVGSQDTFAGG